MAVINFKTATGGGFTPAPHSGGKEGGSNAVAWVVGILALAGISWVGYKYLIKPMLDKKNEENDN